MCKFLFFVTILNFNLLNSDNILDKSTILIRKINSDTFLYVLSNNNGNNFYLIKTDDNSIDSLSEKVLDAVESYTSTSFFVYKDDNNCVNAIGFPEQLSNNHLITLNYWINDLSIINSTENVSATFRKFENIIIIKPVIFIHYQFQKNGELSSIEEQANFFLSLYVDKPEPDLIAQSISKYGCGISKMPIVLPDSSILSIQTSNGYFCGYSSGYGFGYACEYCQDFESKYDPCFGRKKDFE